MRLDRITAIRLNAGPRAVILAVPDIEEAIRHAKAEFDERLATHKGRSRFHNGMRLVTAYMHHACYRGFGPDGLTRKQFRNEGKIKTDVLELPVVTIHVFKGDQVRVYGGLVPNRRPAHFLCTAMDEAKKQDKADPAMLRRAASILARYITENP